MPASINWVCSLKLDHRQVVRESFPNTALSGSQFQASAALPEVTDFGITSFLG